MYIMTECANLCYYHCTVSVYIFMELWDRCL